MSKSKTIPNSRAVSAILDEQVSEQKTMLNIQLGENGMPGYNTTGNSCLDLFSLLSRGSPEEKIVNLFKNAYLENQELALKIMMNYRDRDGKQEKDISRTMMKYLKQTCPATYIANLLNFIEMGYLKDLIILGEQTNHSLDDIEAKVFANLLRADVEALKKNEPISLAGKWAPREKSKFDVMAEKIAFFFQDCPLKKSDTQRKKIYRKHCSALNAKLNTLERNLSSKNYDAIKIEAIPATALKKTKKALEQHMPEKYKDFLQKCQDGKIAVKTQGIQPHELGNAIEQNDPMAEVQLNEIVRKLKESGVFQDTLPLCDVSGSMSGVPMQVSVMMGYIVSQLQNNMFKDKVITFSQNPTLVSIVGSTTAEKLKCLERIDWGMNTDFIKAFEMILEMAKKSALSNESMVKQIIVFTDMQFDQASTCKTEQYATAHQHLVQMYAQEGYSIPKIIYWNLRDATVSVPVKSNVPGVALMNGFSSEMLKIFMESGEITPYDIMLKAVDKYEVVALGEKMNPV